MTPAAPASEIFAARRRKLLDSLGDENTVVLFAGKEKPRNGDVNHPFRQDSYFWYLTGFPEAQAVAVIRRKDGKPHYTLFSAKRDRERELWTGKIIGQETAVAAYGVDDACPLEALETLAERLADSRGLYTILGIDAENDTRITGLLRDIHRQAGRGGAPVEGVFDLRRIVDRMRMFKTATEQNLLREAGRISAAGHRAAMLATRAGAHEYTLQAAMEAEFRRHGGCERAFATIVAGGANACCLHYTENTAALKSGDLVLLDAGAEYGGYAGDISRTIPIDGKFSRDQEALYEVVLNAQQSAIAAARPGIRHLDLHRQTAIAMLQGMIDLGIIEGDAEQWVDSGAFRRFYPHGTGHWLGLDVHDAGLYKVDGISRAYAPDMVVTIEPGLYLQPDDSGIDERWRGIGIRIEDDILITEGEAQIISDEVPKSVREIEAFLATRR